ncbi:MAG: hypothetical protein R3D80_03280 [Paracoccaceae bacterium]
MRKIFRKRHISAGFRFPKPREAAVWSIPGTNILGPRGTRDDQRQGSAWRCRAGAKIFAEHFGVNFISVKDEAAGGGALPAYQNAVNDLAGSGQITVRFPAAGG